MNAEIEVRLITKLLTICRERGLVVWANSGKFHVKQRVGIDWMVLFRFTSDQLGQWVERVERIPVPACNPTNRELVSH